MATVTNMTASQLNTWIRNLEDSLKADPDSTNKWIYEKWLEEAIAEKQARFDRKYNYLKSVGKL